MNTISPSQSSSYYTYLCSDCNTIPSIQLIDSQERHVRIHCKTCNTISNIQAINFNQKKLIRFYYQMIKKLLYYSI